MQDRYTGDIGDFVKYGLLRAIRGRKRLGVAWYLHPDGGPEGNGQHTAYLQQRTRWRHLDPDLFDALKRLVDGGERSVGAVQAAGVLDSAAFAVEPLDIARVAVSDRKRWRSEWFERVRNRLSGCDLVFADPDNGLCPDERFQPTRRECAKRIPLAEAAALAAGRAAVIYHHNTRRRGGHAQEIQWWMGQLPGCTCAYYSRRWSNRTFFIVNADDDIEHRLVKFEQDWRRHGQLFRIGAPDAGRRPGLCENRREHQAPRRRPEAPRPLLAGCAARPALRVERGDGEARPQLHADERHRRHRPVRRDRRRGGYQALLPHTLTVELFGYPCRCLDLPGLIRAKRATGRPRDLDALAELEALLEEPGRRPPES